VADRLDQPEFYHMVRQQPKRPVGIPLRGLAQTHRDDLRLLLAVQAFLPRWGLTGLPVQRDPKSLCHQPLTKILHGLHAARKRLGDLRIRPVRTADIRLQQDLCSSYLLRRALELLDDVRQFLTFLLRQPHNILLVHRILLLEFEFVEDSTIF